MAADSAGDGGSYDGGTANRLDRNDTAFNTPILRECWRTAPYVHDGSATNVLEVLQARNPKDQHGRTLALTSEQLEDLGAYVLSL